MRDSYALSKMRTPLRILSGTAALVGFFGVPGALHASPVLVGQANAGISVSGNCADNPLNTCTETSNDIGGPPLLLLTQNGAVAGGVDVGTNLTGLRVSVGGLSAAPDSQAAAFFLSFGFATVQVAPTPVPVPFVPVDFDFTLVTRVGLIDTNYASEYATAALQWFQGPDGAINVSQYTLCDATHFCTPVGTSGMTEHLQTIPGVGYSATFSGSGSLVGANLNQALSFGAAVDPQLAIDPSLLKGVAVPTLSPL